MQYINTYTQSIVFSALSQYVQGLCFY